MLPNNNNTTMDKLLSPTSEEFDKEHYEALLQLVEKRYGITLDQIIESKDKEEVNDNMYYALDMLLVDPLKWLNIHILRTDPKLDINFVNELKKNTCQFEKKCHNTRDAALNGHLECLKYLHESGCSWNKSVCYTAAQHGHLECLKYAHMMGCPWDENTRMWAAYNGHLDCLKYAHENNCPRSLDACTTAVLRDHLDCLKYLHENGCSWNEWTCICAAKKGSLKCLKYAIENGCPFDKIGCINFATRCGKVKCIEYLESL